MISISAKNNISFNNNIDFCIGTGRMGLALQKQYIEQLAFVQKYIGFKHIRGHGLFHDDMSIYHEKNGIAEYNWTYLDMVMDSYKELNLKPFLELGFMPAELASHEQTLFYWKAHTVPPADYGKWCSLVTQTLTHLMDRYGTDEVLTWPIEVWNEPNLPGFWKDADMKEYFKLFKLTFCAIKKLNSAFKVGGPAVCGGTDEKWISAFMEFCHEEHLEIDFVTRHHYTTELPENIGHYGYAKLSEPELGFANLHTTRTIIDKYSEYKGLDINVTENNTSYIPNCPLHDTNQNAAYMAHQLSRLGDDLASYSYWTFGDIFEERGVPFSLFHGGFGLIANNCIPKPTFWTFVFYRQLNEFKGNCVYHDDNSVIMHYTDDKNQDFYRGILWHHNIQRTGKKLQKDFVFSTLQDSSENSRYTLVTKSVTEKYCNPLKIWHDIGEPANPSQNQVELIKSASFPHVATELLNSDGGMTNLTFTLEDNDVIYFELKPVTIKSDAGYDYNRVMGF